MLSSLFQLVRPALFALSPEDAHEATLKSLECGLHPRPLTPDPGCLAVEAFGLKFTNPLAIAAGFDKDARVPDAVVAMGCGFAEVGTTTPRPQTGNPRPRVFRLISDHALINRLGFNNKGHQKALANLARVHPRKAPLSINIGANKDSADRAEDYVLGLKTFYDLASFFVVNISSPNTPGLRDLQAPAALDELLSSLFKARDVLVRSGKPKRPVVVKIAPDIAEADLPLIVARLEAHRVDGISVSNTTLARPRLKDAKASEAGGLSGRPLFHRSTVTLARVHQLTKGAIPLIGIGGIESGEQARHKIEAGATLLQLYTGLIYRGPGLISEIKSHLADVCRQQNLTSVIELKGREAETWANKPLDVTQ